MPHSHDHSHDHSDVPILAVAGLCVKREGNRILDGIDWRVEAGEHWAIVGANGSGKTSLLGALTGYLTPSDGEIEFMGEHYGAANWPELRRRVGLVSSSVRQQMADAEPVLRSVISGKYAMIDYWGRVKAPDREEAMEILGQIDCLHLAGRPWRVLSQGERQRVLIGRALMARPSVLILDEPCAGLDPVAREHFLQFMDRFTARKKGGKAPTLVLVTHHVEEIGPGISHVLALKDGRVLAAGKRAGVLRSAVLSEVFGEAIRLVRRNGRAALLVEKTARRVFGMTKV